MDNYERIMKMSREELARFIVGMEWPSLCEYCGAYRRGECGESDCKLIAEGVNGEEEEIKAALRWLREEASDEI